jgi:hypothetical protein
VRPLQAGIGSLTSYIHRLQRCCERVESEFAASRLRVTDVELVYTSGFLAIVTKWEAFLEDSLYESVCGRVPAKLSRRRHVDVNSRGHLQRILLHPNKDYVSFTTVKQARGLYGLFLKNDGPFGAVSEANQSYIQQAIWIRNAIAHSSDVAGRAFRERVPGVSALPSNRRHPGAFLRHQFRQSPSQRRLDLYCLAFLTAAAEMGDSWSAAG